MSDTNPFTKEELDDLNEYIYLTLSSFDEDYLYKCDESSNDYIRFGALRQRIDTLSDKLRVLASTSR